MANIVESTGSAMRPTAAEVARTLARGRLEGTVKFADGTALTAIQHATDRSGRPLLLSRRGDGLAEALLARTGPDAPRVWLTVDDVPPVPGAPKLGHVRLSGVLNRVPPRAVRPAVLEFAQSNPSPDLFDVGTDVTLHLLEVQRVSIDKFGVTELIDPVSYAAAEPDPLHECERELLEDLADHHGEQIERLVARLLKHHDITSTGTPRAARLDRYGFVIDLGTPAEAPKRDRWMRLEFARGVRSQHDLAHLLHPLLFHDHGPCHHHD